MTRTQKIHRLLDFLRNGGPCGVALSGGVDSGMLLAGAKQALGENVIAVTALPPYVGSETIQDAANTAACIEVEHRMIPMKVPQAVKTNPPDRCYFCKLSIFQRIKEWTASVGISTVYEGSNIDDLDEHRPGKKALRELGIASPLQRIGFTKLDIRQTAREWGLPIWNKPAETCLLTRIPHNRHVEDDMLVLIEAAEKILSKRGMSGHRVRFHDTIARIEVPKERLHWFCSKEAAAVTAEIKKLGFLHVCLDLGGYVRGGMGGSGEAT